MGKWNVSLDVEFDFKPRVPKDADCESLSVSFNERIGVEISIFSSVELGISDVPSDNKIDVEVSKSLITVSESFIGSSGN